MFVFLSCTANARGRSWIPRRRVQLVAIVARNSRDPTGVPKGTLASTQIAYSLETTRGSLLRRNPTSLVSARNAFTPRADAPARDIVLAIYLATDGRPLAACRMFSLTGATAEVLLYALRSHWLELKDNRGLCLTAEGRRLAIRQAN